MVITLDFESSDPGSNPGRTSIFYWLKLTALPALGSKPLTKHSGNYVRIRLGSNLERCSKLPTAVVFCPNYLGETRESLLGHLKSNCRLRFSKKGTRKSKKFSENPQFYPIFTIFTENHTFCQRFLDFPASFFKNPSRQFDFKWLERVSRVSPD